MQQLKFLNEQGDFILYGAQEHSGIYFPLVNESGMMSSVTPLLSGDCKTGQNTFLLAPASAETLHESRASRNFWVQINGGEPWSAAGQSAPQQALRFADQPEEAILTGGLLWQNVRREHRASGLRADILSFVPADGEKVEIMQVTLTNGGTAPLEAAPTAAVPLYARSADNIREHRHVTSLLHRVELRRHIRQSEWVGDGADLHWFNSYYDNAGRQVEGLRGETVRMMLTGQVFCILSGAATGEQVRQIVRAADWYLCHPARGGYCLNTDFGEVKLDMGRMFGFAYGSKENGAVFSHMAVMYAYALYARGCAAEGWRVLAHLFRQSADFAHSQILPGIPEYFDLRGRGMYPYLTGAASWMLLVLQTQAFGVRGRGGDLVLDPRLTAEQFDDEGIAEIRCTAAGRKLRVRYENPEKLDWGAYRVDTAAAGDRRWEALAGAAVIRREELPETDGVLDLTVTLAAREGGEKNV